MSACVRACALSGATRPKLIATRRTALANGMTRATLENTLTFIRLLLSICIVQRHGRRGWMVVSSDPESSWRYTLAHTGSNAGSPALTVLLSAAWHIHTASCYVNLQEKK